MCGIWFSIGINCNTDVINSITHRGPDGDGWRTFKHDQHLIHLGHRRLSIQDLSDAGQQPMSDVSGRYCMVFNGEIYNHLEIRKDLEKRNIKFLSHSDTETLLYAFIEWGEQCLSRLNGMFAFVIWDNVDKKLFAARDRFGVKPLFCGIDDRGNFAFASEVKQFFSTQAFQPRLNSVNAQNKFFSGDRVDRNHSLFKGIDMVKPGHYVSWTVGDNHVGQSQWYDIANVPMINLCFSEASERLGSLLEDSVDKRLLSDAPIGAMLSGGLDSSSIVGIAAHNIGQGQRGSDFLTFTSWAPDKNVDEREFSRAVVEKWKVSNLEAEIKPIDLLGDREKIIWHHEAPFSGFSIFAEWNLYKAISENTDLKVVLDGQGADEMLYGYLRMLPQFIANLISRGKLAKAFRELQHIIQRHPHAYSATVFALDVMNVFSPSLLDSIQRIRGRSITPREKIEINAQAYRRALLSYNIYPQLQWQDRTSMAFGIESRQPFLDYKVVEFLMSLQPELLVKQGRTKMILRHAMKKFLPQNVYERDNKFGFPSPGQRLLTQDIRQQIISDIKANMDFLNEVGFKEETDNPLKGKISSFEKDGSFSDEMWQLSNIVTWKNLYKVS
ncbi:putative Asparagine synthetase [Candidatus Terasakiella magnetica]|uniref:asparagine synthase (glutamine-hydrolyzing) n=1 Tax=Candidatus Terasakiella magnetica TaxID=1867952 RepID=A0A1C3RG89_9PROT|nr:asparagine synthase (glutamine-hydrolyzing) [Candidatus Terasakiella magnetica]SCA56224.1 putative Asparagine synthetase [Candidatus Terasakiella magnetica]